MSTGLQRQAIRLLRNVTYPETSSILLQVYVKTGVKPPKEDSILSVEEDQIKIQVQSPGVNDRANTAVKLLLSKVDSHRLSPKVLNVPKTNINIIRGDKAHYKSLSVTDYTTKCGEDAEEVSLIKAVLLKNAVISNSIPTPPPLPEPLGKKSKR